jgi:putative ABC transport system ATP-binding protein
LGDRAKHTPNELSGGQQQRVAIARALVTRPPLLLADEPTGNLDSQSGKEVLQMMKDIHQAGNTIVLITHDLATAEQAERVVRIHDGRIIEDRKVVTA